MKTKTTTSKPRFFRRILALSLIAAVSVSVHAQQKSALNLAYAQGVWNDAQLQSVFNHLSQISGIDFVLDPNVTGTITLSVTKKNWREMCDIVCKMKQLTAIEEPAYIYIIPEKEYMAQMQNKEAGMRGLDDVKTLTREMVKINNVPADEMFKGVKELLSKRGKITVIAHTNSLVIYDLQENITQIKEVIARMDIEVEQVSIAAKIVEVDGDITNNMGIHWSLFDNKVQHLAQGTGVVPMEKATFSILTPQRFELTLDYLFTQSKSNFVAQPQITTLDNKQAKIFMGSQIPILYQDEAQNTLIKMVDAGTELLVTPHITGEGRIMLELAPSKRSYTINDKVPTIFEQSAQTNVVVNDGETVVIAGLNNNEVQKADGGIPLLKDIPVLGYLFKRVFNKKVKNDLIIFVTPTIIKKGSAPKVSTSQGMIDTLNQPFN